jgi:pimeloyl-ACP methyl ester carboxylesterase
MTSLFSTLRGRSQAPTSRPRFSYCGLSMSQILPFPRQQAMQSSPDALWLNVSPGLHKLDHKLLGCLARHRQVSHWAYRQTPDEPSSLDIALTLLHDFLKSQPRPVHLLGHGTGGVLGLLYARKHPRRVKSLTLLSVGVNPMVDWQAHYYAQLEKLPCSRRHILTQMAYSLFGYQAKPLIRSWVNLLEVDLTHSPSPHSLLKRVSLFPGGVPVPLMVCGGGEDPIIDPHQIQGWRPWLKPEDRIWTCPEGRHFFHATFPQQVASQVLSFWEAPASHHLITANQEAFS